ncbi:MAG: hypothetical protein GY811_04730 [Myxococcales bacterium]|nr:hypothetical protein [Myxococcales bacterium]
MPHCDEQEQEYELSAMQSRALHLLVGGMSVSKAAEEVGVDRSTLHRWLRDDWAFKAAVNGARIELQRAVQLRLAQVASSATEVVATAIDNGDVRAAIAVLKGLGALSGGLEEPGSDRPGVLAEEAQLREAERKERNLLHRHLMLSIT